MNLYILLISLAAVCWTHAADRNKIIIVAMSGLRHDYVDRPDLPTFRKFILEGFQAKQLDIPFVTNAAPSLATIVTGLWPEEHGILDDSMADPTIAAPFKSGVNKLDTEWMKVRPIWITAEEAGIKTAVSGWQGSDLKFGRLSASFSHDYVSIESDEDSRARITEFASWMYSGADLGLLLLPQPDNAGHEFGAESDAVKAALRRNDNLLKFLLENLKARDGLDEKTNIIVVGDHGMMDHNSDHVVYLSDLNVHLGDLKWITSNLFTTGMMIPHADRINDVYGNLTTPKAKRHLTTYLKKDIPDRYHLKNHRRTPPILIIPEVGYRVEITRPHTDIQFTTRLQGMHGYDNNVPEMKPSMLALGPDFKKGMQLNTFHSNEIYPLVCSLLKLTNCHGSDGKMDNPKKIVTVELTDKRLEKEDYLTMNTVTTIRRRPGKFRHGKVQENGSSAKVVSSLLLFTVVAAFNINLY